MNELELVAAFRADVSVNPVARRAAGEQLLQLMHADPALSCPAESELAVLAESACAEGSACPTTRTSAVSRAVVERVECATSDHEVRDAELIIREFIDAGSPVGGEFRLRSLVFIPHQGLATVIENNGAGKLHVLMNESVVAVPADGVVSVSNVAGETLEELIELILETDDERRPEAKKIARDALELISSSRSSSGSSAEYRKLTKSKAQLAKNLAAGGAAINEPEAEALVDELSKGTPVGVG